MALTFSMSLLDSHCSSTTSTKHIPGPSPLDVRVWGGRGSSGGQQYRSPLPHPNHNKSSYPYPNTSGLVANKPTGKTNTGKAGGGGGVDTQQWDRIHSNTKQWIWTARDIVKGGEDTVRGEGQANHKTRGDDAKRTSLLCDERESKKKNKDGEEDDVSDEVNENSYIKQTQRTPEKESDVTDETTEEERIKVNNLNTTAGVKTRAQQNPLKTRKPQV
ncbi:hypothetical protein Pcinc_038077 [Petrolisthes cinctipes]|uniref:Uncharacterized protein n=1 Tax=Petrolisthes cinctipes TaxID=88211 RepID=A0AAE1BSA4_PETCI|nr:hypothetical protein Pcinc_038077 [Petrolisthes cinctipes]